MVSKDTRCSGPWVSLLVWLLLGLVLSSSVAADNEWTQHGADLRATKFADLTQIHAENPRCYDAVALMDAGDTDGLRDLLATEGDELIHARGYLDEFHEDDYFAGSTLLHHVGPNPTRQRAPDNHPELVKVLLDAGADPNTLNHDDNSPIHLAITGGQLRRQQMLSRGVPEDVRFAAALGDMEGLARHFDRRGRLQDDAIPGLDASDRKQRRRTLDSALQFAAHWDRSKPPLSCSSGVQTSMVSLPACMGLGIRGLAPPQGRVGRTGDDVEMGHDPGS